ncbi:L,D-transpeptidase family protein [Alkalihalobacterium chitinilyticum]|uniref:L,D-transpeptidase family protein n=1 Tax=Alkalihalobacterium chitinilyticum TaxID=2980103 RepID=A0ABT5VEJ0_9BACI|nr:L,D-transpeptidase family protein [Alkalihalobacterium chitinilyticum]MDE5413747.1 L,D-transpeptidase family protein [Alkalihalobacterium chitinilyticum]
MSKKSKEHSEFIPRSVKHKRKKKKSKMSSFILVAVLLLLTLGGATAAVLKLGLVPSQLGVFNQEQQHEESNPLEKKQDAEKELVEEPSEDELGEETDNAHEETDEIDDPKEVEQDTHPQKQNEVDQGTSSNADKTSSHNNVKPRETNQPSEQPKSEPSKKAETVITHEVKPNETLYSIVKKYYTNPDTQQHKVAQFNKIANPATDLKAGQKLNLPDPDIIAFHKVESGETLFNITMKYYQNADQLIPLANYNQIVNPAADVKAGMTLTIPHPTILKNYKPSGITIKVNKTTNTLTVYQNSEVLRTFSVATGKDASLTPEGTFQIVNKVEKPWYNPKNIPGGSPNNPLGSHWLGLNVPGTNNFKYGIHGTNDPSSIGKHVSLGCIRMHNEDVLWMYNNIPLQTTVYIVSE